MTSPPVAPILKSPPQGFGHVGRNEVSIHGTSVRVQRTIDLHPVDMQIRLPQGKWFPWQRTSETKLVFCTEFSAQTLGSLEELARRLRAWVAHQFEGFFSEFSGTLPIAKTDPTWWIF